MSLVVYAGQSTSQIVRPSHQSVARKNAHYMIALRNINFSKAIIIIGSLSSSSLQLCHVPSIMHDVQWIVRIAVHHLQVGPVRARGQVPDQLPGRFLHGQEAAGVHGLSDRLRHLLADRLLFHLPARLDPEQEGPVHGQGERQL